MDTFIQALISSITQLIIFSLVPLIWWLITARKETGFFDWIGLRKPKDCKDKGLYIWCIGVIVAFLLLSVFILYTVRDVETATSGFKGLGIAALPSVLVYAVLQTGLSEEIVFRGFLLKRISAKFGFAVGNTVQSILFGALHGIMFFAVTGAVKAVLIILFTGGIGWCMGYINEKKADGSIIPGWCIHSAANIFSGLCSAFMLFS